MTADLQNASPTSPTLHEGLVLPGGFRLIRPLGEGTFALVWLAEQVATGREFALKIARRDEHLAVLRRQARTPEHPSVVAIHSLQDERPPYFLVLEYVEGASLRWFIDKHASMTGAGLPADWARLIFRQVADAIAHAHAHGVIHGDLKPENILVDPFGNAKVADFGVVRTFEDASVRHSLSTLARPDAPFTPVYLPPEARSAGTAASTAGDVYALGVVLHEMIAGVPPQGGDALHDVRPGAPAWADEIFRRTYTSVGRRLPSALALLHEVKRLVPEGPVRVAPIAPPPRPHAVLALAPAVIRVSYGGFWRRAFALSVDAILLTVAAAFISVGIGDDGAAVVMAFLAWLYFAGLEGTVGATVGKAMVGVRVVDEQMRPISLLRAFARYLAKGVSVVTLGLGFLIAGFDRRKQALHDMLAGTVVIHRP